jgi:hypothetical protein
MNVIEWAIFGIPWWVQTFLVAVIVTGVFLLAMVLFGRDRVLPFIIPAFAFVGLVGVASKLQQSGWNAKIERDKRVADKEIERAKKRRVKIEDDLRKHPDKLRDDDGYRRD